MTTQPLRLTRAEREHIIFNHIKGQETPGYEVIQQKNGKYKVKVKPIEIEEEEEIEENEEIETPPEPKTPKKVRISKQDVKNTLKTLLPEPAPEPEPEQPIPYPDESKYQIKSYKRRRLIL